MSYIFASSSSKSEKPTTITKATEATENIRKYRKDRENIVSNYIKTILAEVDRKITEISRRHGAKSLDFNYAKIQLDLADKVIEFGELEDSEHLLIREKILEYLTTEGFQYEIPGHSYNSRFYRTHIKISWKTPVELDADNKDQSEILENYTTDEKIDQGSK